MKISELNAGQGDIDVTVEVTSVEEPREFEKFGKTLKVANAVVKDDSGEIKMTLWNEDIEKIKQGMTLHITNGYCSEFKGEKQITTGKFGKFEVLDSEKTTEQPAEKPSPENSEENDTI